jgi:DNA polymerase (family 10)
LDNHEVASVLLEIAELLDIEGESAFRVRAYERAAQVVRSLPQDINDVDREDKLIEISGIGRGIADRLHELLTTGKMAYFEELKSRIPETMTELVHVSGLGPKKAKLVHDRLGITTLEELKEAVSDKKLRELPGMGAKTEANIMRGIDLLEKTGNRLLLNEAVPAAEKVIDYLQAHPEVSRIDAAGSLRRRQETVGDIDILCATDEPSNVADIFCAYPEVEHVVSKGERKCSVRLHSGLQVDIRLIKPDQYGAALQYFTGSRAHNIHLREIAKKKGLKLSEYGVFDIETGRSVAGETEADVYAALGLAWMEPNLRENKGEIEAAAVGALPELIRLKDIKGDLHVHTRASDGQSSLREMVEFARSLGYKYFAVSDHGVKLHIAGGLSEEDFEKQWREIDELNQEFDDIAILKAAELNIDNEGRVDFPAEFLSRFDVVTASIHAGFNQGIAQLTERMVTAIRNPHINIIGHPTGRILGRREPYALDLGAVFEAAATTGTALELNSFPDRLDLNDGYLLEGKKMGCRFAVNTDAHHSGQLTYMRYGIDIARRGWLEAEDVINTYPVKKLKKWLREQT